MAQLVRFKSQYPVVVRVSVTPTFIELLIFFFFKKAPSNLKGKITLKNLVYFINVWL